MCKSKGNYAGIGGFQRGTQPNLPFFLLCRWSIPLHSEVVFLYCSARLLIRCLGKAPSEQENVSLSFMLWFFLAKVSVFLFFFNARLVEA